MALVVKPAILSAVKTPTDYTTLDILLPIGEKENQNLLLASKITIGSAAEAILTQLVREDRITSNEVRVFRKSAQKFTLKILSKMCEKNPINYALVRNANCFDPSYIKTASNSTLRSKLKSIGAKLVSCKIMQSDEADKALMQYSELVEEKENLPPFDLSTERLDTYFFENLQIGKKAIELGEMAKLMFTLGHGQADVERGFSINKTTIKTNQSEMSLISRRLIKDHMNSHNLQPHTVPATKEILFSISQSNKKYKEFLEENKKNKIVTAKEKEKASINKDIKDLQAKIKDMKDTAKVLEDKATKKFKKAETNKDMSLVT